MEKLMQASLIGDVSALSNLHPNDPLFDQMVHPTVTQTPLHVASLHGHTAFASEMLRLNPELSRTRSSDGYYPIHLASTTWGRVDIVREMLAADKSLARLCDVNGYTALHCAAANNQVEVLAILLKEGSKQLAKDETKRGETTLHVALNNDMIGAATYLVEHCKEILNVADGNGNTALHYIVTMKQVQILNILLAEEEISKNPQNAYGLTPLDVIQQCPAGPDAAEIIRSLSNAGCNNSGPPFIQPISDIKTTTTSATPSTHTTLERLIKKLIPYYCYNEWVKGVQQPMIVMATIMTCAAFQAGLNPPKAPEDYNIIPFLRVVMVALIISASTLVVLVSGLSLKHRLPAWLLKIAVWGALTSSARSLQYIALVEYGSQVVTVLDPVKYARSLQHWESAIVGYIIGKKPQSSLPFFSSFRGYGSLKFDREEDMNSVVEGGPWTMDHRPFILRKWSPDLRMEQESLSSIPIWARLPNLPMFLWDRDTLSRIGSLIGTPLFMDSATLKGSRATFSRLCIEVEAIKPIPDSVVVEVSPGMRESFKVEYDWKPSACQFCHSFGHDEALCGKKPKMNDVPVITSHDGVPNPAVAPSFPPHHSLIQTGNANGNLDYFKASSSSENQFMRPKKAAKKQLLSDTITASTTRASNSFDVLQLKDSDHGNPPLIQGCHLINEYSSSECAPLWGFWKITTPNSMAQESTRKKPIRGTGIPSTKSRWVAPSNNMLLRRLRLLPRVPLKLWVLLGTMLPK
ncbi:hypothetical protein QJS04_geneDACA002709 [Acorus gramineus]|uniref:DUF4283 domain-containing protein n=1 Tax=Acorus gramineus TaxID=55184 RepID=A0AAV9ATM7_ACOGR|nr:hypothetical protein QJS04_geneDACA002709 [Acorus gramineus]